MRQTRKTKCTMSDTGDPFRQGYAVQAAAIKEEQRRHQEWVDRDRKIKEKLERMGDVMKKSN